MPDFAITVLKLSAFVGIAIGLAHPRQAKMTRLSLGIILIAAIMIPIVDIIVENGVKIPDFEISDIEDAEMSDDMIEEAFCRGIEDYIREGYSLGEGEVTVTCDGFDLSSMRADKLYVALSGRGIYVDYKELEYKLAEEFTKGGTCRVEFDI